ncbi:MAG: ZIP family metal transporter [Deltaproteobacteria bacterium]|nr:ZIP family metal transporter [Deltaproteobacteria bacterium]MBI3296042.1 ZIP family metal transporter [Deltaproteobacteria bacterium]
MTALFFYCAIIFLGTFLGGIIPTHLSLSERKLQMGVALGAGLLLGMSLVHMIPEAAELMPETFGIWLLAGFLILLVAERFVMVHACEETHCDYHTIGWAAFIGLTIHGLIEGAALASSLVVPKIGPMVLIAIVSHKLPSGIALSSILKMAGISKRKSVAFVTGVAISGPVGLFLSYALLSQMAQSATAGALLSMSAGTFLYIGACDLLPEMHRGGEERQIKFACFLVGIGVSLLGGLIAH